MDRSEESSQGGDSKDKNTRFDKLVATTNSLKKSMSHRPVMPFSRFRGDVRDSDYSSGMEQLTGSHTCSRNSQVVNQGVNQSSISFKDVGPDEAEAFVQKGGDLIEVSSGSCMPWLCRRGSSTGSKSFWQIDPSWQALMRLKRKSVDKIFLFDIQECFALVVDDSDVSERDTKNLESFVVKTSEKRILFCAASRQEAKFWVTALQLCLLRLRDNSSGIQLSCFLRYQFQKADLNHDGKLVLAEVKGLFRNLSAKPADEDLGRTFKQFDKDNNGEICEDEFFDLLCVMMVKQSLKHLFKKYSEERNEGERTMSWECFKNFLKEVQGMSDCEIDSQSEDVSFEKLMVTADGDALTEFGFGSYLCRESNSIFDPKRKEVGDMTQPLSNYWINCSHNTYLEGSQWFGTASVEQYIEVVCQGCRCVEIDCCSGKPPNYEPQVTHVHTLTNRISFQRVVQSLKEHAFTKNRFPLILSLENKCDPMGTIRLGEILSTTFGDMLLTHKDGHRGQPLISPAAAMGKVIVKAKLQKCDNNEVLAESNCTKEPSIDFPSSDLDNNGGRSSGIISSHSTPKFNSKKLITPQHRDGLANFNRCVYLVSAKEPMDRMRTAPEVREATEMCSFRETQARKLQEQFGSKLNTYHRTCLTRVYPPPAIGSTNLSPMSHWIHGVQMVALNFQTPDVPMVLQEAMFRVQNGGCGYVLKPISVLDREEREQELAEQMQEVRQEEVVQLRQELPPAMTLTIHIYSAHFLPKPRCKEGGFLESLNPYVVITIHAEKVIRGKTQVKGDGFAPCFDEKLTFSIYWPAVTLITFEVYHQARKPKFIAAAAYPVVGLRSGLRWVPLWDYRRSPIENCGLLVEVTKFPEEAGRRGRVESETSVMSHAMPVEEVVPDEPYASEISNSAQDIWHQEVSGLSVEGESPLGIPDKRLEYPMDSAREMFHEAIDANPGLHAVPIQPPLLEDAEEAETSLSKCLRCNCGTQPKLQNNGASNGLLKF